MNRIENLRELLTVTGEFEEKASLIELAATDTDNIIQGQDQAEKTEGSNLSRLDNFLEEVSLLTDLDNFDDSADSLVLMTLHNAKGLEFPHVYIVGLEEDILPHIRSSEDESSLQEERRLFYVGITRAKKTLTLTHARERRKYGNRYLRTPSRFLEELPDDLLLRNYQDAEESEVDEKKMAKDFLARIKDILQ